MKVSIRRGVFETNSSSVHSLVMSRVLKRKDIDPEETRKKYGNGCPLVARGMVDISSEVRGFYQKLSYLITVMWDEFSWYLDFRQRRTTQESIRLFKWTAWYGWLRDIILKYTTYTDLDLEPASEYSIFGDIGCPQSVPFKLTLWQGEFEDFVVPFLFDDSVYISVEER